jgi:hypothetical protein
MDLGPEERPGHAKWQCTRRDRYRHEGLVSSGNGRQLAERLALARPGMKVLYLSGYPDDAVVRHGVLESETAFLQKPFTTEGLAIKVRHTLDAGAPHSGVQR